MLWRSPVQSLDSALSGELFGTAGGPESLIELPRMTAVSSGQLF